MPVTGKNLARRHMMALTTRQIGITFGRRPASALASAVAAVSVIVAASARLLPLRTNLADGLRWCGRNCGRLASLNGS
jgi:hypothetical protein